jgi:hypothetical protein
MLFFKGIKIIPQLFHLHTTTENYSKTPQNEMEIFPSGDPASAPPEKFHSYFCYGVS